MTEMKNSKVAYIIVGWNNLKLLEECFKSIENQTYPNRQIIFVDNNSNDGSADWVRRNYPATKIIALQANTGFVGGNNIGIKEALSDTEVKFVSLVNTDARLDKHWTESIINFAKHKPRGACFQGTTLDYYDHGIIDSTHIYISHNGQGTQGDWRNYVTTELGPKKIFGVNAAACIITRKFIEEQPFEEFFDSRMFMYLEDVDIAARATVLGWDNYLVPAARAYHMGSVSSSSNPGFSLYMTFRNNSALLYKNFPWRLIWRILPKLIRGDIDTIRTLKRRRQKGAITKVLKGRFIGIFRLPFYYSKRRQIAKHRQINTEYLWQLMKRGY